LKRIGINILSIIAIVFALNYIYSETALIPFVDEEAGEYLQARKVAKADVLYVSESSNFSPVNSNDTNTRKLSQFVSDYFPNLVFEAINKPAAHAGHYKKILETIPENNHINTVIIAVNMRSFSASWINSHLETPLNKSAVFYNNRPPLINRFLMGLNAYDDRTSVEREREMFRAWAEPSLPYPEPRNSVKNWTALEKWGDWRNPKRQLADHYVKQYAYVLSETNPRIKDLDEIVSLAQRRNWNLVFSILAENIEEAEALAGEELVNLMKTNLDWIIKRYGADVLMIDNMELLGSDEFTEKDFPSEHYYESGRRKIAENIANHLKGRI